MEEDCSGSARPHLCWVPLRDNSQTFSTWYSHCALILQSPQFWPIPTRTIVMNRCTAAIHWAGYELSANQHLRRLQVVLAAIGQN